ncbi:predicted protein [Plenodomus lingam JN3]|uniref:Predicted protein n=1 Tax=Leptosphaeria maculans (strain JN3 / isolate v23.1.3 / race Av1-4-5-6-7-8) TaxID=985895 RepID=E4ZJ01_LEPMJ|nr:predicted protein [Plenodomus lingam JN3]CBX91271.1 predicted protein [Plenodomus lingam JN3]
MPHSPIPIPFAIPFPSSRFPIRESIHKGTSREPTPPPRNHETRRGKEQEG